MEAFAKQNMLLQKQILNARQAEREDKWKHASPFRKFSVVAIGVTGISLDLLAHLFFLLLAPLAIMFILLIIFLLFQGFTSGFFFKAFMVGRGPAGIIGTVLGLAIYVLIPVIILGLLFYISRFLHKLCGYAYKYSGQYSIKYYKFATAISTITERIYGVYPDWISTPVPTWEI